MEKKIFIVLSYLVIIFIQVARTQDYHQSSNFSIGIDAGYFLPMGDWYEHRYAAGVEQFKGDLVLSPIIEMHFLNVTFGVFYNYSRLNVEDWEEHASTESNILSSSAHFEEIGLIVKYYFNNHKSNWTNFQFGLSYLTLKGQESYRGFTYDYDFFESGVGFFCGMGYDYLLSDQFVISFNARIIWASEVINYPEKGKFDFVGMPFTFGVRILI